MRAPEEECVNIVSHEFAEIGFRHTFRYRTCRPSFFGQGYKEGTRFAKYFRLGSRGEDGMFVFATVNGALSANNADTAVAGAGDGGSRSRIDHADYGNIEGVPKRFQRERGSRIGQGRSARGRQGKRQGCTA